MRDKEEELIEKMTRRERLPIDEQILASNIYHHLNLSESEQEKIRSLEVTLYRTEADNEKKTLSK